MYNDNYLYKYDMGFTSKFIKTGLFCCIAFIAIPAAVYAVSYIPYLFTENTEGLKTIIDNQRDIFIYHSKTNGKSPEEVAAITSDTEKDGVIGKDGYPEHKKQFSVTFHRGNPIRSSIYLGEKEKMLQKNEVITHNKII